MKFGPSIVLAKKPERPLPEKEIFFASHEGGCSRFPSETSIRARIVSDSPPPLPAFGIAIRAAVERIWILDEYLLKDDSRLDSRIQQLLDWLHPDLKAGDIKILTTSRPDNQELLTLFEYREQEINRRQPRRETACRVEVRTHLAQRFDFVHDRFAIIDDELWHFGATVGGLHQKVNAASRGWRASEHGAIDFFNMVWKSGDCK